MNLLEQLEKAVGIEYLPARENLEISSVKVNQTKQQADVNKVVSLSNKPQPNSNKIINIH